MLIEAVVTLVESHHLIELNGSLDLYNHKVYKLDQLKHVNVRFILATIKFIPRNFI